MSLISFYISLRRHEGSLENAKKAVIEAHKQYQFYKKQKIETSSYKFNKCINTLAISFYNVAAQEHYFKKYQQAHQAYQSAYKIAEDNLGPENNLTKQLKQAYDDFSKQLAVAEAQKLALQQLKGQKHYLRPYSASKKSYPDDEEIENETLLGCQLKIATKPEEVHNQKGQQLPEQQRTFLIAITLTKEKLYQQDREPEKGSLKQLQMILKQVEYEQSVLEKIREERKQEEQKLLLIRKHANSKSLNSIIKIQSFWRGYFVRKQIYQQIEQQLQQLAQQEFELENSRRENDSGFISKSHIQQVENVSDKEEIAIKLIQQLWRYYQKRFTEKVEKMIANNSIIFYKYFLCEIQNFKDRQSMQSNTFRSFHKGILNIFFDLEKSHISFIFIDYTVLRKSRKPYKFNQKLVIDSTKLIHVFSNFVKMKEEDLLKLFEAEKPNSFKNNILFQRFVFQIINELLARLYLTDTELGFHSKECILKFQQCLILAFVSIDKTEIENVSVKILIPELECQIEHIKQIEQVEMEGQEKEREQQKEGEQEEKKGKDGEEDKIQGEQKQKTEENQNEEKEGEKEDGEKQQENEEKKEKEKEKKNEEEEKEEKKQEEKQKEEKEEYQVNTKEQLEEDEQKQLVTNEEEGEQKQPLDEVQENQKAQEKQKLNEIIEEEEEREEEVQKSQKIEEEKQRDRESSVGSNAERSNEAGKVEMYSQYEDSFREQEMYYSVHESNSGSVQVIQKYVRSYLERKKTRKRFVEENEKIMLILNRNSLFRIVRIRQTQEIFVTIDLFLQISKNNKNKRYFGASLEIDQDQLAYLSQVENPISEFDLDLNDVEILWKRKSKTQFVAKKDLVKLIQLQLRIKAWIRMRRLRKEKKSYFLSFELIEDVRVIFSICEWLHSNQYTLEAQSLSKGKFRATLTISEALTNKLIKKKNPLEYVECDLEGNTMQLLVDSDQDEECFDGVYEEVGVIKGFDKIAGKQVNIYISTNEHFTLFKAYCREYDSLKKYFFKVEDPQEIVSNLQLHLKGFIFKDKKPRLRVYSKQHEKCVVRIQQKFKFDHYQRKFKVKIPKQQAQGELFVGTRKNTNTIYMAINTLDTDFRNFYKLENEHYHSFISKIQFKIMTNLRYTEKQGIVYSEEAEHRIIASNSASKILQYQGPKQRFKEVGLGVLNGIYDSIRRKVLIAGEDRKIEAAQIDVPPSIQSIHEIQTFTEDILTRSFIIQSSDEICVVYYEKKDEENVQIIQKYLRSEQTLTKFQLSYFFAFNELQQKLMYELSLIRKDVFSYCIRQRHLSDDSKREYELEGVTSGEVRDLKMHFRTRCCLFLTLSEKGVEVDVAGLVEFNRNGSVISKKELKQEVQTEQDKQQKESYIEEVNEWEEESKKENESFDEGEYIAEFYQRLLESGITAVLGE